MDGALTLAGVDPHSTTLRAWCSAVWAAVVDLLSRGVKVDAIADVWSKNFEFPDTADGEPDRDTWGLLPEHVAGQMRLQNVMNKQGGR